MSAYILHTDKKEIDELVTLLQRSKQNDTVKRLLKLLRNLELRKHSSKIDQATKKATAKRTATAKKKIQNAVNILRIENKKITHYSVAKTACVSYTTVKKYLQQELLLKNKNNR